MVDELFAQMEELMRETFEGGKPGEGTQYLDHDSGIRTTLKGMTAEQASRRVGDHPSIAGHVRHMSYHMRAACAWIAGDHGKLDWKGSFLPHAVTVDEWNALIRQLEEERTAFLRFMKALPPEKLVAEGAGMGSIAHLAYHLGAIRQLLPAD